MKKIILYTIILSIFTSCNSRNRSCVGELDYDSVSIEKETEKIDTLNNNNQSVLPQSSSQESIGKASTSSGNDYQSGYQFGYEMGQIAAQQDLVYNPYLPVGPNVSSYSSAYRQGYAAGYSEGYGYDKTPRTGNDGYDEYVDMLEEEDYSDDYDY